ncbi:MAG: cysteine--tRNA ligase [Candidatus Moraniibacteriota bacterium]
MLSLYNTLSKKKEIFTPLDPPRVKFYTCGPTVYDYVHIGNLRSYVAADTLRRVLEAGGAVVEHVKNITDVGHLTADDIAQGDSGEDKMVRKALAEHKTPAEIAAFYTDYYHETEFALNILPPQIEPHATSYIPQMIQFIEGLIKSGHAYAVNGNVFFDVTSYAAYGRLSGNTLAQLKVGARLEEHPDKKNPWDFALWLRAPESHLMHWDSPWGTGYPGWHIECSAMNLATIGATIDIHTGGEDNIFPHHEAEIAQSECGNQAPFVRYWIHTRHLLVNGQRMAKSKKNFYRLEDVLERGYSAMDLRMLYLSAHYRSQMNFTWDALAQAKINRESLMKAYERLKTLPIDARLDIPKEHDYFVAFLAALEDDLNTPLALATALNMATLINSAADKQLSIHPDVKSQYEKILFGLFGLKTEAETIPKNVLRLMEERKAARANKDFTQSDALRDEIAALGYNIEDGPDGQAVKKR